MSTARNERQAHDLMATHHDAELERWIEATGRRAKPRAAPAPRWADTMPSQPGGLDDAPARPQRRSRGAWRDLLPVLAVLVVAAIAAVVSR